MVLFVPSTARIVNETYFVTFVSSHFQNFIISLRWFSLRFRNFIRYVYHVEFLSILVEILLVFFILIKYLKKENY